jgi:polar amino acid transport system substrate-binding protein
MPQLRSRRQVISGAAALPLIAASAKVWAQADNAGQGLLARLRQAKKVTAALANNPPYSSVLPDGSLDGIAPTLTKLIMARLGGPEVVGVAANYGELIPGMQAGRWDFITASLTISKARCSQVAYADPIVFDGGSFVSLKGELADPPKTLKALVAQKLTVGVSAGGAIFRLCLESGISPDNVKQFPDDVAMIDGLVAKRIQIVFQDNASISLVYRQRNLPVDVTFPIADVPEHGSGCAFRPADTDLYDAYQQQLRAMKASGEYLPIAQKYGFYTPPELLFVTADQACATST